MVISEQSIDNVRASYGAPAQTTSGGKGLPFMADQSLFMEAGRTITDPESKEIVGQMMNFSTQKTRFVRPKARFAIPFYYDRGPDNLESMFLFLVGIGEIKQPKSGVYLFSTPNRFQEFKKSELHEAFKEDFWSQAIQEKTMENLNHLWIRKSKAE